MSMTCKLKLDNNLSHHYEVSDYKISKKDLIETLEQKYTTKQINLLFSKPSDYILGVSNCMYNKLEDDVKEFCCIWSNISDLEVIILYVIKEELCIN